MDKGFIEGQVVIVRDQTEQWDFIVRTQDGDYHVDFDDGYYYQCVAEKLDGKTVKLGYYSIETNPDGTRWVQAGDDNTLEEMKTDEHLDEDDPPRRILKRPSRTINNVIKEVRKEEKKEVTAVKKMEEPKDIVLQNNKKRIAVYTCITGDYDKVPLIKCHQDNNIDFIFFTDYYTFNSNSNQWIIRPIPDELNFLSNVKKQRVIKICSSKYLKNYDLTLWIDGNLDIIGNINDFINEYSNKDIKIWSRNHPSRNCLYDEEKIVLKSKKDSKNITNVQIKKYKLQKFPRNFGLHETNILLRIGNDKQIKTFENFWASEVISNSHRDQLSFDYCRWKTNINVGTINIPDLMKNKFFRKREHGR